MACPGRGGNEFLDAASPRSRGGRRRVADRGRARGVRRYNPRLSPLPEEALMNAHLVAVVCSLALVLSCQSPPLADRFDDVMDAVSKLSHPGSAAPSDCTAE
jgi:hypothetical protein